MKRIVVVTTRKIGVIADISTIMAEHNINIETVSATDEGGHSTVTLTTDQYDEALRALAGTEFNAVSEEAFVIKLEDRPGALAKVAERFKEAGLNIRGMHLMGRGEGYALAALTVDNPEQARELLSDVLVTSGDGDTS